MIPTSIIALFCDDIREEKSGALTLVGVMGDNVLIPSPPSDDRVGMLGKIGIYIRINFDVNADIGPIAFHITMPDGKVIQAGGIEQKTIDEAKATGEKGNPMGGIVTRLMFGGIVLKTLGRITVEATIGDATYVAGFLNFVVGEIDTGGELVTALSTV